MKPLRTVQFHTHAYKITHHNNDTHATIFVKIRTFVDATTLYEGGLMEVFVAELNFKSIKLSIVYFNAIFFVKLVRNIQTLTLECVK